MAWVRIDKLPAGQENRAWVANKNSDAWTDGYYGLLIRGNAAEAAMNIGGSRNNRFNIAAPGRALSENTWYHLASTYDGEYLRLFVDGAEATATRVGKTRRAGTGHFRMGRRGDGFGPPGFPGVIDDVRLYREALAGDAIAAIVANPTSEPAPEQLVQHWTFEGGDERQGPDLSVVKERAGLEPPWRKESTK
jgi:hypothetical protein